MVEPGEMIHQFEHFGRKGGISFNWKIISTFCKKTFLHNFSRGITYQKNNFLRENPVEYTPRE